MRVHIENDEAGPPALRVSAERLRDHAAAFAGLPTLDITEHSAAAYAPVSQGDAQVLLACRKLHPGVAKATNPPLAWVQVISAGVETWLADLPASVMLTNASGVHGPKGAEFIVAACLMLNFGIPGFVTDKEQLAWRPSYGGPIAGKTVTMLGVGGIGRAAVAALRPFGVTLIGVTRSGTCAAPVDFCVSIEALETVLPRTDMLVSTLPLTPATQGLIDRRRLELLPRGAGVVVVGRAAVVDYAALAELLVAERLGGAVLDVFPSEPLPPEDPLWACPRLIMTPHCSLDDHARYMQVCLDIFCGNLVRFVAGEPLANLVDPVRGY